MFVLIFLKFNYISIKQNINYFMEYNDFPILTNDEYDKMKNEYLNKLNNNNETFINNICFNLFECVSICNGLNGSTDKTLRTIIEKAKIEINELYSNISFSYKIEQKPKTEVKDFNVFILMRNIIKIITSIERYKSSFNNNEKTLLSSVEYKLITISESIIDHLSNKQIFIMKHF